MSVLSMLSIARSPSLSSPRPCDKDDTRRLFTSAESKRDVVRRVLKTSYHVTHFTDLSIFWIGISARNVNMSFGSALSAA